LEFKGVLISP